MNEEHEHENENEDPKLRKRYLNLSGVCAECASVPQKHLQRICQRAHGTEEWKTMLVQVIYNEYWVWVMLDCDYTAEHVVQFDGAFTHPVTKMFLRTIGLSERRIKRLGPLFEAEIERCAPAEEGSPLQHHLVLVTSEDGNEPFEA